MAFELKQSLRLSQQLVMTPQLQQAIKLLQLNRMELVELINQELVENPVLDETNESPDAEGIPETPVDASSDPEAEQKRDEEAFNKPQDAGEQLVTGGKEDFNWESYVEEFNSNQPTSPSMREINEELPAFESILTKSTTLEDHILWQISMTTFSAEEKKFATLVAGNLSDDGYLIANFEDLARESKLELEDAEEILKMIRQFDPIGVGSRTLGECLMTQALLLKPRQELMEQIIIGHLADLERRNYAAIAKALNQSMEKIVEATKLILELEPKPGRSFTSSDAQYITPDIYVVKVGTEYVITLNEDGLPKLRISPYYKNILQQKSKDNKDTKEYVQDKLRSAMWLIKSIHNRQKTIYKVTEAIVVRQRDFFEKGVSYLKPMVLKDIAGDIGMHESTISRVTTNKYVHTPVGIFELKYFFNSSINSADGGDSVASEAVKQKIKQMIAKEDPKNPLSDQKIAELLIKENIDIARRTVAKYREMLGILSSAKRKKVF
jgi:RNA polymerase sigma-54 factor